jgi:hypothetical protein
MEQTQTQTRATEAQTHPHPERRFLSERAEFRAGENGKPQVFGYALKWGVPYDMGWFTEIIDRNALDGADLSDVRVLFNHDPSIILGRTKANTAQIGQDDTGLWYLAELPDSPNGQNVRVSLERGDVDQSSWAFYLDTDKWETVNGRDFRTILRVRSVVDTSAVTYPANPDTSAAKRSLEAVAGCGQVVASGGGGDVSVAENTVVVSSAGSPDLAATYERLCRSLELMAARTNK